MRRSAFVRAVASIVVAVGAARLTHAQAASKDTGRSSISRPRDTPYAGRIVLAVDARDVERGVFHVAETVPITANGSVAIRFVKWVPGNHAPTGRIEQMAGLTITADGTPVRWTRDAVDMYLFHLEVPRTARALDIRFDYLSATSADRGRVVMTPAMLNLQWFSLVAYPAGYYARQIIVEPSVLLPGDWQFSSQLRVADPADSVARFRAVTLEALVDAPIFAGRYFRRFELGTADDRPVFLDVVADAPQFLDAPVDAIEAYRRLVRETARVFGRPPFEEYHFMLALTREMGGIGTEHLSSSENTRAPGYFADWQSSPLLAHEFAHAWNGKARRPAELWSPDFAVPMRASMLWMYEGQSQFWGFVLAARAGLMTREQIVDAFARLAGYHDRQAGRGWRPLRDTGNDAIMTNERVDEVSPSWHRALNDSYTEAALMWLEVDGLIRELSGERRGIDDVARGFFVGGGERPSLYGFEDVVKALHRAQPYGWDAFLQRQLDSVPGQRPEWLRRSGYRLAFSETPTDAFVLHERQANRVDLTTGIGLMLGAGTSGEIRDVIWGSAAYDAALVPGAVIVTVNGQPYSAQRLRDAIAANRDGRRPLSLVVRSRGAERSLSLDYRDGFRYPRLERVPGVPDRLGSLLSPRASRPAPASSPDPSVQWKK